MDGFWTSQDGTKREYWAGGLGGQYKCGCGVTRSCDEDTVQCNCDIQDGKQRKDFGTIINKDELPVGSVTLNDIGGDSQGTLSVGALRCGQRQFGKFTYMAVESIINEYEWLAGSSPCGCSPMWTEVVQYVQIRSRRIENF